MVGPSCRSCRFGHMLAGDRFCRRSRGRACPERPDPPGPREHGRPLRCCRCGCSGRAQAPTPRRFTPSVSSTTRKLHASPRARLPAARLDARRHACFLAGGSSIAAQALSCRGALHFGVPAESTLGACVPTGAGATAAMADSPNEVRSTLCSAARPKRKRRAALGRAVRPSVGACRWHPAPRHPWRAARTRSERRVCCAPVLCCAPRVLRRVC
jgi:hypothetical protein